MKYVFYGQSAVFGWKNLKQWCSTVPVFETKKIEVIILLVNIQI